MPERVFYATMDSWMRQTFPTLNFGSDPSLYVGTFFVGAWKTLLDRAIGNFDVSDLAGQEILSADLERYAIGHNGAPWAGTVNRCTRATTWTELGVTWDKFNGVDPWTNIGGDYSTVDPVSLSFVEENANGWEIISGMKPFVDYALASEGGIVSLIMRATDESDDGVGNNCIFASRSVFPAETAWLLRVVTVEATLPARRSEGPSHGEHRGLRPAAPSRPALPGRPTQPYSPQGAFA